MKSGTPRTARLLQSRIKETVGVSWVSVDFAKQLERELAHSLENQVKAQAEFERLKTLMHQTIWFVDDMIKTHTKGCEHCIKKQGAMIALFKDITIEPQWPIDTTAK